MSTPILYMANEEDFSTMGLGTLRDASSVLVTEERNGLFELEMKYPVSGNLIKEIKNDRLIKVDASPSLKNQRFRIVRITTPAKGMVTVYAEHVSYLSQDLQLKPEVTFSGDALSALTSWENGIVDEHPFSVYSNVLTENSGKWSIDKVDNARQALGGVRGSILDKYRGEYRFDNYHISLLKQRGTEDGALIAYGKNLIDLEQEDNIASTYTSVYPYAVTKVEGEEDTIVTLPEYFIDSEYVESFARRKILPLDLSEEDEVLDEETLRERAEKYIEDNNVGVPKISLKVNFMDLAKTLEYEDLKIVENIELCDYVWVYFEDLGIRHRAKVIKVTWNALMDRFEEIEIGDSRVTLSQSVSQTIESQIKPVEERLTTVQITANGKNKIYRGAEEPTKAMKAEDIWYKPVGDGETELYTYDGVAWRLEKVSAGLLGGTLDAENGDVNLINVNVQSIVGETAEFVKANFNSATGGRTIIDGDAVKVRSYAGEYSKVEEGGMRFYTRDDILTGSIETGYTTAGEYEGKFGPTIYIEQDNNFSVAHSTDDGEAPKSILDIFGAEREGVFRFNVDMWAYSIQNARNFETNNDIFSSRFRTWSTGESFVGGTNGAKLGHITSDSNSSLFTVPREGNIESLRDIEAPRFRASFGGNEAQFSTWGTEAFLGGADGSIIGFVESDGTRRETLYIPRTGTSRLYSDFETNALTASFFRVKGTNGYFTDSSGGGSALIDSTRLSLSIGTTSSFEDTLVLRRGSLDMYGHLDMNGWNITNQSDVRLKKNIEKADVDALSEIEKHEYIWYEWDKDKRPDTPDGKQFGIKAQYAPFLQTTNSDEESYMSIDMSKYIHLVGKGVQELHAENKVLKERIKKLEEVIYERTSIK